MNTSVEKRTIRKVILRIVPYMFIAYLVSFVDRVSLTYASIGGLDKALGLTSSTFGLLSGIFFISYFFCEIPSNLFLAKFGARKWIARILVSWGVVTFITAWVNSATSLLVFRFLLGMAEAGFFPGMILYITYWFRQKERAKVTALFMTAPPIANALGAPAAVWVVQHNWLNFPGWRWIFILAGIPAVVIGVITFFFLDDGPKRAKWLKDEEKDWLISELRREEESKVKSGTINKIPIKDVFKNKLVWRFTFINFTYVVGLYGITFWMPRIIKSLSNIFTNTQIGWITVIPYFCGAVAMVFMGRHSDSTGERKYHAAFGPLMGAIGLIGVVVSPNPVISIIMICIATSGLYSFSGPYWALTSSVIAAEIMVVGTGIINCVGNLGGFIGPYIIGILNDLTGNFTLSVAFLALMLGATCIQVMLAGKHKAAVNKDTFITNDIK
ncbi:MFS transporter [Clostridium tyrobutyricum]|uniref:MFS transporter n=1 Tax=Clostridium tyrobutyricum TaxID=1519 RepID=UPI0009B8079D|nr:MFS transporter [Clostridium tyrobutyricum]